MLCGATVRLDKALECLGAVEEALYDAAVILLGQCFLVVLDFCDYLLLLGDTHNSVALCKTLPHNSLV